MSELMNNESVLGILQGFVWAIMGVTFFYGSYTNHTWGKTNADD